MVGNNPYMPGPLALAVLLGSVLPAQDSAARVVWALTPSLIVAAVHDDNIFLTEEPTEEDRILRYTPGLALDYTADALHIVASYSQDAEYYEDHEELDSSSLRRAGLVDMTYQVSERFSWGLNGSYVVAPTPGELNLGTTGLQLGRIRTERQTAGATADFRFSPTLSSSFAYTSASDETEAGIGGDTRESRIDLEKSLSARNLLLLGYTYRQFEIDNPPVGSFDEEDSHTAMVGMEHQFSARTTLRAMAGPRYYSDSVEPNIELELQHDFGTGEAALTYTRSETLLAGSTARVETDILAATFSKRIGRRFEFHVQPGYGRAESEFGTTVDVLQLGIDATYSFNDYLALSASWQHSRQDESFPGGGSREIPRDVFLLSFTLAYPLRGERL